MGRSGSEEAIEPGNSQCSSPVWRIQLGVQTLKSAIDGCSFHLQRSTDHFAAVTSGLMSKQFEFGVREVRPEQQFLSHGLL